MKRKIYLFRIGMTTFYTCRETAILQFLNCAVFIFVELFFELSISHFSFRIRQLNWVNSQHLDCRINETKSEVCDLVYTAIAGMQYVFLS